MISKRKQSRLNNRQIKKHQKHFTEETNTQIVETSPACSLWTLLPGSSTNAPRKRGRPRKYFPHVEGKTLHRMDDENSINLRSVSPVERQAMIKSFKLRYIKGIPLTEAIEQTAKEFKVTYGQAFEYLNKEF